MPKFFFNYLEDTDYSPDEQGITCASVEEAYLHAYEGAIGMWSDLLSQRQDPRRSSFVVTNADNETLFVFPFVEVLESCQARQRRSGAPSTYRDVAANAERARRCLLALREEM